MQYGTWRPYAGGGSIVLAAVLLLVTVVLLYVGTQLRDPIEFKRPGKALGGSVVAIWFLSLLMFLVAAVTYGSALLKQVPDYAPPVNPITPLTDALGLVAFMVIALLSRRAGFWIAFGSAVVGTIAAPMIFELPFDLIVMWRTYAPDPAAQYTLLFFLPLFLIEISSFAMVLLSPVVRLSRNTLFALAGMFLVFAVWALFGYAYPNPATPIPVALNMVSKVMAFVAAVSLFLPPGVRRVTVPARAT
jgi:hypothetical protein